MKQKKAHKPYILPILQISLRLLTAIGTGVLVAVLLPAASANPATVPAGAATTAPAHIITLPAGFVRVVVADRVAMCESVDQPWVRDCLEKAPPGTQPSTRPADMLLRLNSQKASLESQISQQLSLKDSRPAAKFVDETLLTLVQRLDRLRVKVVYLVSTREDLKRLVIGGWSADQFHYNRVADKIAFNGSVDISLDGNDGESVVPAPYLVEDSVDARTTKLRETIGRTEAGVGAMVSRESQSAVQLAFAKFIVEAGIEPLNLKLDQEWFSAGVVGDLSTLFLVQVSGGRAQDIIQMIARPDPNNPVSPNSIDLAHPIPPDQLRPAIAGAYGDAFRRRSIAIVASWANRAGPDAIAKTIAAIRATPPKDGTALLELIHKTTGIDLSSELAAQ